MDVDVDAPNDNDDRSEEEQHEDEDDDEEVAASEQDEDDEEQEEAPPPTLGKKVAYAAKRTAGKPPPPPPAPATAPASKSQGNGRSGHVETKANVGGPAGGKGKEKEKEKEKQQAPQVQEARAQGHAQGQGQGVASARELERLNRQLLQVRRVVLISSLPCCSISCFAVGFFVQMKEQRDTFQKQLESLLAVRNTEAEQALVAQAAQHKAEVKGRAPYHSTSPFRFQQPSLTLPPPPHSPKRLHPRTHHHLLQRKRKRTKPDAQSRAARLRQCHRVHNARDGGEREACVEEGGGASEGGKAEGGGEDGGEGEGGAGEVG